MVQLEKDLATKERYLKESLSSRNGVKKEVREVVWKLEESRRRIRRFVQEKTEVEEELEEKHRMFEWLQIQYKKQRKQLKSEIEPLENLIKEKEEQLRELEERLKRRDDEFNSTQQELQHLKTELCLKTKELAKMSAHIGELETKIEHVRSQFCVQQIKHDQQLMQMIAKTTSPEAHAKEITVAT